MAKAAGRAQTTREGQIKGKLGYMAPEQLTSSGVNRQTDVYAASVVLWEMLAGERLFAGGSEVDVIAKLLKRDIKPPSELAPGIPKSLDDIVMRGLSADVNQRFATARDLCVALGTCGLQEAAGIAVGEWVEGLATEALALRSAKIAAIESQPEGSVEVIGPHPSTPPNASIPAGHHPPSLPTVAAVAVPVHGGQTASTDGGADDATAIRRNVRIRILGAAAALAAGIAVVAFAFARGGTHGPERASAALQGAPAVAPLTPSPSPFPVPAAAATPPPVATAVANFDDLAPAPTQSSRPPPARAAAPAPPKAPPAGARSPRTTPPPAKVTSSDAVFDRRD